MLSRAGQGRAWTRTTVPDSVSGRSANAVAQYDDFSGPFGVAARDPANGIQWAENFDLRFPGYAFHAQALVPLSISAHASWNGRANFVTTIPPRGSSDADVLVGGYGFLTRLTPANSPASEASRYIPAIEGTRGVFLGPIGVFGSYCYVGDQGGTLFHRINVGGGEYTSSALPGQMFAVAGNRLWRFFGPATSPHPVYAQSIGSIDPETVMSGPQWSATLNIGDGRYPIRDVRAIGEQIYVSKQDGLYVGDQSGTFFNVLGEIATDLNVDNGAQITVYNGAVIYPYSRGLLAYYHSTTTPIVREIWRAPQDPKTERRGSVRSLMTSGRWLYAGLWTGGGSHILAGTDASPGLPFPFSPLHRLPHLAKIRQMHIDGVGVPMGGATSGFVLPARFWAITEATPGVTTYTAPIYSSQIPRGDVMPMSDLTFSPNYCGSAAMYLGQSDFGLPTVEKVARAVEIGADLLASGVQWGKLRYAADRALSTVLKRVGVAPADTAAFPTEQGQAPTYDITADGWDSFSGPIGANGAILKAAGAADENRTYLFGGDVAGVSPSTQAFAYNEATDAWVSIGALPSAREDAAAVYHAPNGYIYIYGGYNSGALTALLRYDATADTYTALTSSGGGQYGHSLVSLGDYLYAVGGIGAATTIRRYSIADDTWGSIAAYPGSASQISGAALNGLLYVVGDTNPIASPTFYSYAPGDNAWTARTAPGTGQFGATLIAARNGRLYLIGGGLGGLNPITATVREYDPVADTWNAVTSLTNAAASGAAVITPSGRLLVYGGSTGTVKLISARTSGGQYVTGRALALSLESFTATLAQTPIYRSFTAHAAVRPRVTPVITARITVADTVKDNLGSVMRPGAMQLSELRALEARTAPVILSDITGVERKVVVVPPVQETEIWDQGEESPWVEAQIVMAELDFSGNTHAA